MGPVHNRAACYRGKAVSAIPDFYRSILALLVPTQALYRLVDNVFSGSRNVALNNEAIRSLDYRCLIVDSNRQGIHFLSYQILCMALPVVDARWDCEVLTSAFS